MLLAAIFDDLLLVTHDVGRKGGEFGSVLDLRECEAVLQELTSPNGTGSIHVKSFSGRIDTVSSV